MKKLALILLILFFVNIEAQSQNLTELDVKKTSLSSGLSLCISDCEECGKLIFSTTIPSLKFESSMGNIKEQTVFHEVNEEGNDRFTYKVVTLALPIQHIIIKGPITIDYDLIITDLQPVTCQEFYIRYLLQVPVIKPADSTSTKGSILIKTFPSDASVAVDGEPQINGFTPYLIKDHVSGAIKVKLDKTGYIPVDTVITIIAGKESEITVSLKPAYTPPPPPDPKLSLNIEIKKQSKKQVFWLTSTILTAGTGGYFMYAANQKYKEYKVSTDSHATGLRETFELYDKLGPAFFALTGVCTVEFTLHTIKKNKYKNKLNLSTNGQSAKLTYAF